MRCLDSVTTSQSALWQLEFLGRLHRVFPPSFIGYLALTYLGLKGAANSMVTLSLLPFLKSMKVSATMFQLATMVSMLPWGMKGFVGVLSDCVPIGKYHKKGYLMLASLFGLAGLTSLVLTPVDSVGSSSVWRIAWLFCCIQVQISTFDLLCEGKYSEMMREERMGSEIVTFVWFCVQVGALCGAVLTGIFIDSYGPRLLLASVLPLALLGAWRTFAGDLPELPARSWRSLRLKVQSEPRLFSLAMLMAAGSLAVALSAMFFGRFKRSAVTLAVSLSLVVYSFAALPRTLARSNLYMFLISVAYLDVSGPLAYFYTGDRGCVRDAPHFSYSYYLAVSNIVGSGGAAAGAVLFQYMQQWSFQNVFIVTTAVQVVASVFDLVIIKRWNVAMGIPDEAIYLFGDAACQSIAQQMVMMPQAILTARLCPRGAEATVYAVLAGFQNFGMSVSSILGVQLSDALGVDASQEGPCDFEMLPTLVVVAHGLIPMACVPLTWMLVPNARVSDEEAFEVASPLPSFRSPDASPRSPVSPRFDSPDFDPVGQSSDEYVLMEDDGLHTRHFTAGGGVDVAS